MTTVTTKSGVLVTLTQDAFLSGTNDAPYYEAHGVDADGYDYKVTWDCVDNYMELEDESDCCDWENYSVSLVGQI